MVFFVHYKELDIRKRFPISNIQYRFLLHYREHGTRRHRNVVTVISENNHIGSRRDREFSRAVARYKEVAGVPIVIGLLRADLAQDSADECFGIRIDEIQLSADITGAVPRNEI